MIGWAVKEQQQYKSSCTTRVVLSLANAIWHSSRVFLGILVYSQAQQYPIIPKNTLELWHMAFGRLKRQLPSASRCAWKNQKIDLAANALNVCFMMLWTLYKCWILAKTFIFGLSGDFPKRHFFGLQYRQMWVFPTIFTQYAHNTPHIIYHSKGLIKANIFMPFVCQNSHFSPPISHYTWFGQNCIFGGFCWLRAHRWAAPQPIPPDSDCTYSCASFGTSYAPFRFGHMVTFFQSKWHTLNAK